MKKIGKSRRDTAEKEERDRVEIGELTCKKNAGQRVPGFVCIVSGLAFYSPAH